MNKKGGTSPAVDEATSRFIEFSKNKKVLEVGGGYGLIMAKTLKRYPKTVYHINDLDERHLYLSAKFIKDQNIPLKNNQVRFLCGNIKKPFDSKDRYDAILIARVLHFMNPVELDQTITNVHNALKVGGRVYVVAITPYVKLYARFIHEYEKKVQKKSCISRICGIVTGLA